MEEVNVRRVPRFPVSGRLLTEVGESVRTAPRRRHIVVDKPAQVVNDVERLRFAPKRRIGCAGGCGSEFEGAPLVHVRAVVAIGERDIEWVADHRDVGDGGMQRKPVKRRVGLDPATMRLCIKQAEDFVVGADEHVQPR